VFLASSTDSVLRGNTFNLQGPRSIAIKLQGAIAGQQAIRWQIKNNTINSMTGGNNGIYFYPAPRSGPGMPQFISVEQNLFTGRTCLINVPTDVVGGCNYFAGNSGAFRYLNRQTEPLGTPCPFPKPCQIAW
jgi:hypothetical protein